MGEKINWERVEGERGKLKRRGKREGYIPSFSLPNLIFSHYWEGDEKSEGNKNKSGVGNHLSRDTKKRRKRFGGGGNDEENEEKWITFLGSFFELNEQNISFLFAIQYVKIATF